MREENKEAPSSLREEEGRAHWITLDGRGVSKSGAELYVVAVRVTAVRERSNNPWCENLKTSRALARRLQSSSLSSSTLDRTRLLELLYLVPPANSLISVAPELLFPSSAASSSLSPSADQENTELSFRLLVQFSATQSN